MNPERVSPLDIDIDIEGNKREQVFKAFQNQYGADRVSKVLTLRTEKSKSAIQTACLAPDTLIQTKNGLKKIQEISSKDVVYTVNGEEQVVTPTYREYDGKLYHFNCSGIGKEFSTTHNHQLLVYTNRRKSSFGAVSNYVRCQLLDKNENVLGEFLSIKEAAKYYSTHYNGSYNSMYRYKKNKGYTIVELPDVRNHEIQWLTADNIQKTDYLLSPIYKTQTNNENYFIFTKKEQNPHQKNCNYIKEKIEITEELGELIGIYLAEGNINFNKSGITFTISVYEEELRNRIIVLLDKCFGITKNHLYMAKKKDSNGFFIQVNSTPLGRWFDKYCNGLANTKRVPEQILNSSLSIQKRLLYGCFYGDGYARVRENNNYEAKITSISYGLVQDLWQIAARNGYNSSIITETKTNRQTTYNLMFYGQTAKALYESKYEHQVNYNWEFQAPINYNGVSYYKIKINAITSSEYSGLVYCLETPSHNYLLNNIVSHNCRGLNYNNDIGLYLSSLIPSERGMLWTLKECFYGDEENDKKPIPLFVKLMTETYPDVWKVAVKIEGLINGVGSHAGGVIFVDEPFTESTALMKTNNGDVVTQYDLHMCEDVGLIKIDLLSIEALDKIRVCLDLLMKYGYIEPDTLHNMYENTIGIYKIERNNKEMWKMLWDHKVLSLFQMEQDSGIRGITLTSPSSVDDLATINSVMRLMASEKGAEQPLELYAKYKNNIQLWYDEMKNHGLTEDEIIWLRGYLDISFGICETQEKLMSIIQDERVGGHSLLFADRLRKSIAKKKPKEFLECEKEFFETIEKKHLSKPLADYVWNVVFKIQRGYSFCAAHTLAYSLVGLQELNLAYKFPIIFWNCANLIVDSAGMDGEDDFEELVEDFTGKAEDKKENENEEDDDGFDEITLEDKKEEKKKNKTVNYGKISAAIGKMISHGIDVSLPDINKSDFTFTPDVENNRILFGIKGIARVNSDLAKAIINGRPFVSLQDFLNRIKLNKLSIINLIKSGCFDAIEEKDRVTIMKNYINSISDQKNKLTLQNMSMLIRENCIPSEFKNSVHIYNFNKYLKDFKDGIDYILDERALNFYSKKYDMDLIQQNAKNNFVIKQKDWDKIYKKEMEDIKLELKTNPTILNELNKKLFDNVWNKYASGTISKWEMDSVNFYHHEHELAHIDKDRYHIVNYEDLSEEPEVEKTWTNKEGMEIPLFKLQRICGTVIDKDKVKNLIVLLTDSGVVNVKIYRAQFSKYDKQISVKNEITGKKTVIEKSWFSRGNKLMIVGIRRGDSFVPKMYRNHSLFDYPIELITSIDDNGIVEVAGERAE